ncbi:D-alanine--D-alanine ligase family protein [Persephonella sp.]
MNDLRIALVYGGSSSEREISIKSGKSVEEALKRLKIQYRVFDPIKPDIFVKELISYSPDLVFNMLHGKGGEDGSIQGLFETLGFRYTGSPVKASAVAMDKTLTKEIALTCGITTPHWKTAESTEQISDWEIFPAVVKPNSEGSSIGVSIVYSIEELKTAVEEALSLDRKVLIEQFIEGREITVGILNGKPLPPVEITVEEGFYDYNNKYISDKTRYTVEPDISDSLKEKLFNFSEKIYSKLGCRGASRVDFIVKDETPYFLEINTIPGMTDHSLLPKSAQACGIDFDTLVAKIIEGALNEK